ncbi:MAG: VOC family protein [Rubrobacteraceae bacterium]|jgi:predicted enzyme related to lactoylglutathione lyase
MARVGGIDFVGLQVRDVAASAAFYEEKLGLVRSGMERPGAVIFETEPIPFAVREPMVDLDSVERLGWGVALWMNCDDADGLAESLSENGVTIAQEPTDGPFGRMFVFVDPDGYSITMHEV